MWLLYLDESGVPERHPSQTSHYIQLGLAVHEGTWFALEKQVRMLKNRYAIESDPTTFELHAAWMLDRYPEQGRIANFERLAWGSRRELVERARQEWEKQAAPTLSGSKRRSKRRFHRETSPYTHLTLKERTEVIESALGIVSRYRRGLYLFGEAISKPHLNETIDPVEEAFTQIVSRFETFLRNRRQKTWGMLVSDYDDHKALRFSNLLRRFQTWRTPWINVTRVIESPFFLDSHLNSAVQLADVCAFALRRYLENKEKGRFMPILPKFYQTSKGLHGLRHFIPVGECSCEICKLRGRV